MKWTEKEEAAMVEAEEEAHTPFEAEMSQVLPIELRVTEVLDPVDLAVVDEPHIQRNHTAEADIQEVGVVPEAAEEVIEAVVFP